MELKITYKYYYSPRDSELYGGTRNYPQGPDSLIRWLAGEYLRFYRRVVCGRSGPFVLLH